MRIARLIALSILLAFAAIVSSAQVLLASGTTRLAPGDRVTIAVFGQADLSGVFQVDGDGNIELPVVGAIAVGQLSVKECEARIVERLANGYIRQPVVSVRLTEPRPIFILGDVRSPGSFPFRHGSSVLSAIALAGGYAGGELPVTVAVADYVNADERVRTLEGTRRNLLIRVARLEAQREGKTTFEAPATLEADERAASVIAAAMANESQMLEAQTRALQKELELLRGQKPRLEGAADAVEKQIAAEKRQFELVQSQLNDVAKLQTMGLARRTTEVALQREQAVLDSNISRYRSELARLDVTVGDIDIRIQDTQNNYERRILGELQDARTRLQEIDASLPSAREVRELRLQQAGNTTAFDALAASRRIVVTRTINNEVKQMDVAEDTLLEPGDVVDIKKVRTRERAKGASIEAPRERAQANAGSRVLTTTCTWANGRRTGAACV